MCLSLHPLASICLNSSFRNKAVSDGALSFYHDHFVHTRVSKFAYGTFCAISFQPADPDHQQRRHDTYTDLSGVRRVNHSFDVILPKVFLFTFLCHCPLLINVSAQNTQISETKEFRSAFICQRKSKDELKSITSSVWCYRGTVAVPRWKDVDTGMPMVVKP